MGILFTLLNFNVLNIQFDVWREEAFILILLLDIIVVISLKNMIFVRKIDLVLVFDI
jgi:hypothetical protein